MTEETNEDVFAKARQYHDDMLFVVPDAYAYEIPVSLIAALLAELDAVRAERDALWTALTGVHEVARNPEYFKDAIGHIAHMAYTALTAQPAPQVETASEWTPERLDDFAQRLMSEGERETASEWTPRVGEQVKHVSDPFNVDYGKVGTVVSVDINGLIYVNFGHKWAYGYEVHELALVDE